MTPKPRSYPYFVIKYYHYVPIPNVVDFRTKHHLYCIQRNMHGRIKIAPEGINGTVSGLVKDCEKYMAHLRKHSCFKDIQFNITPWPTHVHEKLHVRLKKEIIRADAPCAIDERKHTLGREYIDACTFERMRTEEDIVIVDVRSKYEHAVGKFKNAITFDIDDFRSFFDKAKHMSFDKHKRYVVICTRGIKSVKGWDYLKQVHHLPHVHYLQGGILDYAQQTDGSGFEGVCYVFDNRVVAPIQQVPSKPISTCYRCATLCSRMINCANPHCNKHMPMCQACTTKLDGGCSEACQQHPAKRPYNSTGYYVKHTHSYNPYIGLYRKIDEQRFS